MAEILSDEISRFDDSKAVHFRTQQSIGEHIASVLRDRIAGGVYAPGSWIRENTLAEEFPVSNGPIREALQFLVNEELLVREPRRGVRVVDFTREEILEIFQIRLALLELAAELAAKRANRAQLDVAQALLRKMDSVLAKHDIDAQMPIGGQLSHWVCSSSGNARLAQNWSRLTYQTRMYIHASLHNSHHLENVGRLWHALVDAIENRDVDGARSSVRGLVRRTLEDLGLTPDV